MLLQKTWWDYVPQAYYTIPLLASVITLFIMAVPIDGDEKLIESEKVYQPEDVDLQPAPEGVVEVRYDAGVVLPTYLAKPEVLVLPVAESDDFQAVVALQAKRVVDQDTGAAYVVLGATESNGNCMALLNVRGKVPCQQVLNWSVAEDKSAEPADDR